MENMSPDPLELFKLEASTAVLCWLATISPEGVPNVTPKEVFAASDDGKLLIADIMSSNSVNNIRSNPAVCVSFVDVFRQRGFKIVGTATIVSRRAPEFVALAGDLIARAGSSFTIRNLIVVEATLVTRILAPSYIVFPDRAEADRMIDAYELYGVRPA